MKLMIAAAVLLFVSGAHAQSADSSGSGESKATAPKPMITESREDIDSEITNARLRASTGAKSLISLQSSFNYNGSTINNPLAKERPQLSPGTVENDPAKLTGSISGKYRMTDHDNLNLGVGVGWLTPAYEGQRGQIEDPYVSYGRVFKAGSIQNSFNATLQYYSADSSRRRGLNYEAGLDHTFLLGLGDSGKAQVGLVLAYTRELYSNDSDGQLDTVAAYPFAEYEISQMFSFRTVYRGLTYFNTVRSPGNFTHDDPTQSAGVGIALARDFYLYPNIQWVWGDMRPEKTNVALSANINL